MRPGSNTRRPRGRPNRKQHGSPRSQTFDSHGPDVRIRGNAPQVYEKYLTLARDATASGDRISAESYYQFAEHYFRIMNDSTDPQRLNPEAPRMNREQPPHTPREQPQVEWPVDQVASNGAPVEKPVAGDRQEGARRAVSEETEQPMTDGEGGPTASEESATASGTDEEAAPRRATKGRPRGRRRTANGSGDSDSETAAKARDKSDDKKPSKKSDDSEEAVPQ